MLTFGKSCYRANRFNAAGLLACVEQMAKRHGTSMPEVIISRAPMVNAAYQPATNMLFVTEDLMHLMGTPNPQLAPSRELKAVLSHEFGHIKFKNRQFIPLMGTAMGIYTTGLFAYYLLDEAHKRMKEKKETQLTGEHEPKEFWAEFQETFRHARQEKWKTFKDFWAFTNPTTAKTLGAKRYKDQDWMHTIAQEGKIMAVGAMMILPAFAACRPIALRNEWESDRFMLAACQDKEGALSAFTKLAGCVEEKLAERAKSPAQKSLAKKVLVGFKRFLGETIGAHPELDKRIAHIKTADVGKLAQRYGLA